ncbi:fungal-specific transcription factor domain-containing protein [Ilyonectria destructans]|nr:fungal-specific transcription factor domain-containing protein [Ilyonectria destructans]
MLDDFDLSSYQSTISGQDEETRVYGQARMLQDPTGRLLYVGDSATLSYLQFLRMIVKSVDGPSQFTLDPDRHKIIEPTFTVPETAQTVHMLPEKKAADVLVQFFFTNTNGLIDILDRREFKQSLNSCYSSPLTVKSSDLCLMYLVLSIGLTMAAPAPDSPEHEIVTHLRSQPVDQAEVFFRNAKGLGDPVSGFEDGDFWSIQALCLMSVYMLAVSKRNAAYAYLGMAVRSAYALGLHRAPETAMIFRNDQLAQRRNLWRSLFVLDRFLAMSLGRPVAISEYDCSEDSLEAPMRSLSNKRMVRNPTISSSGLDASVQASKIIGEVLQKVYSKHHISARVAQEIADDCKRWDHDVHPALDWNKLFNRDIGRAQGMAILHIQLLGCHTIILLTRPFFLHLLVKVLKNKPGSQVQIHEQNSRMETFSEACVAASTQTINLTQAVFQSRRLPQRNSFVMYFLFAATLTILSNEFLGLHSNADYDDSISNAVNIMSYFSANDDQASHLLFILTSFRDVVQGQATSHASGGSAQISHRVYPARIPFGCSKDPTESLTSSHHQSGESEGNTPGSPRLTQPDSEKSTSQVSQASMNPQERPPPGMIALDLAAPGATDWPANSTTPLS